MANLKEGTHGGFDLLEKEDRISEDSEKNEKSNDRQPDLLDKALSDALGSFVGGHVQNVQFDVPVPGCEAPEDFEFDRHYFEQKLLVDLHQKPMNDEDKTEIQNEITRKMAFAKARGFKYFPIIGGEVTPNELRELFAA